MAKKKMTRAKFLKMLGIGASAPLLAKLPIIEEAVLEDDYGESEYDIDFPFNHMTPSAQKEYYEKQMDAITRKAGNCIIKGQAVYIDDDGSICVAETLSDIVGIALNNADNGEPVEIMRQGCFSGGRIVDG